MMTKKGRTLVMGDVHGGFKAMVQVLERSKFDWKEDTLIFLGDVCDGWPETKSCITMLSMIPNLIYIMGNHDQWTIEWLTEGIMESIHKRQGGLATMDSYHGSEGAQRDRHLEFLCQARSYYIDNKNRIFTHGGFVPTLSIEDNIDLHNFTWNRSLVKEAFKIWNGLGRPKECEEKLTRYHEVFVGHTSLTYLGVKPLVPTKMCDVWCMDTGAGFEGYLSVMDVDTHEYWQSDKVSTLYPKFKGRD